MSNNAPDYWIGTSWKMNKLLAESQAYARSLAKADAGRNPRIQRFVIPPYPSVREVKNILSGSSVMVGAQNMHWAEHGAWTGEVSAPMLKDCGADLVELGHSERREHFGETDEAVGRKVETAVRHGLVPLICMGETMAEREAGRALEVLETQIHTALRKLSDEQKSSTILLAYEPVWAIGENGIPATAEYADARHAEIIDVAAEILGRKIPCLYGGSVDAGNCEELIRCPHINGLFIGRAAWDVDGYLDILSRCSEVITSQESP